MEIVLSLLMFWLSVRPDDRLEDTMKLETFRIKEFQSILDTTTIRVGDVTCLVGKNESGKTAVLKALYRLNPYVESDGTFDVTDDYPRRLVAQYKRTTKDNSRDPATVIEGVYRLSTEDSAAVESAIPDHGLQLDDLEVVLKKGYEDHLDFEVRNTTPRGEHQAIIAARSEELKDILLPRIPKFLYFDEYYQLKGQDNLDALHSRQVNGTLEPSDRPLLGLLALAELDVNELLAPDRTEALLSSLNAAEEYLTRLALPFWSQNRHIRMKFDIRPARPNDPPGMTNGTNIWSRIVDTRRKAETALGARSRGFVWFFSFLAWYSDLQAQGENLILLLDEPGLSLHAKAQGDLLRYFEEELKTKHQLIYTTHSPFMVAPRHFDRVRIVQDLSIDSPGDDAESDEGTKVTEDVLEASDDSLFPLQSAMGYDIHQTLFVGPNILVVEGASDLLYLQAMSAILGANGREPLSAQWTITPVGGAGKVATFVALLGAQANVNVAVLLDYQSDNPQTIENLYKQKLLKKNKVLRFVDYVQGNEADVEDMFDAKFYLGLVNDTFGTSIRMEDLETSRPRIAGRIDEYFRQNPRDDGSTFNHYRPATHLVERTESFSEAIDEETLDRFERLFRTLNEIVAG